MAANSLRMDRSIKKKSPFLFIFSLALLVAVLVALMLLLEREKSVIDVPGQLGLIGVKKQLDIVVSDQKSGIRHVETAIRQAEKEKILHQETFTRKGYFGAVGPNQLVARVDIDLAGLGFKDGPAELTISARDFSLWNFFRGNSVQRIYPVTFDSKPPKISRMDSPRYIKPGGAGIVVYKLDEEIPRHGVRVNGFFHRGFPVPGKEQLYGAIIGLPYDTAKIDEAYIEAEDVAGNIATSRFGMILKKPRFKKDRITVPKSFLDLKIPEFSQYYPEMSGSQLEQYLYVNNKVRQANNKDIMDMCSNSRPEQLWQGRFSRMARSSTRSGYADHRTYYHEGKEVDKQVHLGIDLASTRHADVEAANKGIVIYADYHGIYGNMVVVDHGLGLFSLYSHLSSIDVKSGDMVEKDGLLGKTGTTGMAGGDHLHFSMLVNGILVNPLEWWDASWIDLHITSYLK